MPKISLRISVLLTWLLLTTLSRSERSSVRSGKCKEVVHKVSRLLTLSCGGTLYPLERRTVTTVTTAATSWTFSFSRRTKLISINQSSHLFSPKWRNNSWTNSCSATTSPGTLIFNTSWTFLRNVFWSDHLLQRRKRRVLLMVCC